jgi:predicted transcriptional regulator
MEVHLNPEQEAELSRIAHLSGRSADELAREAVENFLVEEARFRAGVQAGLDDAVRGNFISSSEVWAAIEQELEG